jgi:hypothetical protein
MGEYLSTPKKDKESIDGANASVGIILIVHLFTFSNS